MNQLSQLRESNRLKSALVKARMSPWKMLVLCTVVLYFAAAATIGFNEAYTASSAAEIVPNGVYIEVVEKDYNSAFEKVLTLGGVLPALIIAEAIGVFAFHYLTWIPHGVLEIVLSSIPIAVMAAMAYNVTWNLSQWMKWVHNRKTTGV